MNSAEYLSPESGRLCDEDIRAGADDDDLPRFARGLMSLQALNQQALQRAGTPTTLSAAEQAVLDLFRDNGALAWGRSPTGFALYGMVRGSAATVELKKKLMAHVGYFSGSTMASTIHNDGARHAVAEIGPEASWQRSPRVAG